ncbi:class III lanthipeptide [Paenibacillus dendritiformis]
MYDTDGKGQAAEATVTTVTTTVTGVCTLSVWKCKK